MTRKTSTNALDQPGPFPPTQALPGTVVQLQKEELGDLLRGSDCSWKKLCSGPGQAGHRAASTLSSGEWFLHSPWWGLLSVPPQNVPPVGQGPSPGGAQ